jgi:hypothetical protein
MLGSRLVREPAGDVERCPGGRSPTAKLVAAKPAGEEAPRDEVSASRSRRMASEQELRGSHRGPAPTERAAPPDSVGQMPVPDPRTLPVPRETIVAVVAPPEGITLYRLVDGPVAGRGDFEKRRTRPQAEREGIPELLRLSVSHCLFLDAAAAKSQRRPCYVAEVALVPGGLARLARTDPIDEGHVDVWAAPGEILSRVVRVVRVDRE